MGGGYSHPSLAERRKIDQILVAKYPVAAIEAAVGRQRATIHRDISRNFHHTRYRDCWGKDHRGYYAVVANEVLIFSALLTPQTAFCDHRFIS